MPIDTSRMPSQEQPIVTEHSIIQRFCGILALKSQVSSVTTVQQVDESNYMISQCSATRSFLLIITTPFFLLPQFATRIHTYSPLNAPCSFTPFRFNIHCQIAHVEPTPLRLR